LRLRFQASGPIEDLFQKLDDKRYNLIVIGQPAPPGEAPGLGDLLSTHVIPDDAHNARELAACGSRGRLSICCVRTATSASPGLAWSRAPSPATCPMAAFGQQAHFTALPSRG